MSALHVAAWLLTAAGFYLAGRYGYRRFRSWAARERTRQEFAAMTFDLYRDDELRARFRELNREFGGSTD
jgi:hypothetical protein